MSGALDKLSEELEELKTAVAEGTNVEEELGDLLFSAVNVSRFVKVDTEEALNRATDKFIGRFRKVEEEAARERPGGQEQRNGLGYGSTQKRLKGGFALSIIRLG